jgi:hypothetical protein
MGNSLTSVVSNIFVEHFEEIALDTADHKPANRLRYVEDTFVVWPHESARLQQFLHHLSNVRRKLNSQWKLKIMIAFRFWMFCL